MGPLPPGLECEKGNTYLTSFAFLMNPQSEGSVTLKSNNPQDNPVIDLAYLTHPYDRRVFRELIRATWKLVYESPATKKVVKRQLLGPTSLSDEDIDEFATTTGSTVWHAVGSVKMGKGDDQRACVDSKFKVYGIEGLRVADLSVCPVITRYVHLWFSGRRDAAALTCHTVTTRNRRRIWLGRRPRIN
jgi:choline dehydrogenase-like flavoprotein